MKRPKLRSCTVPLHQNLEAGMSLVATLMAVAITSVLSIQISTYLSHAFLFESDLRAQSELQQVRRWVESNVNCSNTLSYNYPVCDGAHYLALLNGANSIIVKSYTAADFTKLFANYGLRASCVTCASCAYGKKILVEVAQFKPGSSTDFKINPYNKKLQSWTDLMKGMPLACAVQ